MMGNNAICEVIRIGKIKLRIFDGIVDELRDVRHVLNLKRNIILVGMLDQTCYLVKA